MITNRTRLEKTPAHETALDCIESGVQAAHPERVVENTVSVDGSLLEIDGTRYDLREYDRVRVVGGGNAASHLAKAIEAVLGDRIDDGAVVSDDPAGTTHVETLPGGHPVPSQSGLRSTETVLELAEQADSDDLLLVLITGGGSALLSAPAGGISLSELQETTRSLIASGATIDEINAVRKHCSRIKGGRLARTARPATVVGLVVSDVVGNDLSVIASGPLTPDSSTYGEANSVLDGYDVSVPDAVLERLERGARGALPETPTASDPAFENVSVHVLADGYTALNAARSTAERRGYSTVLLSSRIRGEAREAAKTQIAIAEECSTTGEPVTPPAVLVSGGETTVTLDGTHGEGGPNQEFTLSAALELDTERVVVAAVDTDGLDGATRYAGAIVDSETVGRPPDRIPATRALQRHDAAPLLKLSNATITMGATGTNVNDLRVMVVEASSE